MILLVATGWASTWSVELDGSGDFTSLAAAVAGATSGDTLEVGPGTWSEPLETGGKSLTVRSTDGSGATVIDAGGEGSCVDVRGGETVTVEGFTLTGADQGVQVRASTLVGSDLHVGGVTGDSTGGGFLVAEGGSLTLSGCSASGIALSGNSYGGGLAVYDASASLTDCELDENSAYQGGGIYVWNGQLTLSSVSVSDNVSDNEGGGLYVREGSTVTASSVTVTDNTAGDAGGGAAFEDSDGTWTGSTVSGNTSGASGGGFSLEGGTSSSVDADLSENHAGGAGGGVYVVDHALSLSGSLVANTASEPHGQALYANGIELALTDLDISGHWDRAVHAATGSTVTVSGGTWTGNASSVSGGVLYSQGPVTLSGTTVDGNATEGNGGAIYVDEATTTLGDCRFEDNAAEAEGGAVFVYKADLSISGCSFELNSAGTEGGGVLHSAVGFGDLTVTDSTFTNNWAGTRGASLKAENANVTTSSGNTVSGGDEEGWLVQGGTATFEHDSFSGSEDHGLMLESVSGGSIAWSRFEGNGGDGAYLSAVGSDFRVHNSVFAGNTGAGLRVFASNGGFAAENLDAVANSDGVVVEYGSAVSLVNVIAAHNTDAGLDAVSSSELSVSYSAAGGNGEDWAGSLAGLVGAEGNLDDEPAYSDWSPGDEVSGARLALSSSSPCRDAGDPELLDPDGSRSDMGSWGGPDSLDGDEDGDGWLLSAGDCDDGDSSVYPGADDSWYDGVDGDCDGADDYDQDLDGWRHEASGDEPADCDDTDPEVHPEADEVPGDGVDSDCDGLEGGEGDTGTPSGGDTGWSGDDTGGAGGRVLDDGGVQCRGCDAGAGVGFWLAGVLFARRRRA